MNVIVKRKALQELINRIAEDRTTGSPRHNMVPEAERDDDGPIIPSPQMALQLSVDMPPVSDPDFVPASIEELSRSASVISLEVPQDQIDFFYRQLHRLLDASLDKHEDAIEDAINEESIFRSKIKTILEIIDSDKSNFVLDDDDDVEEGEETSLDTPFSMENPLEAALDQIQNYVHDGDILEKLVNDFVVQPIIHQGELYKFPQRLAKMIDQAPAVVEDLFSRSAVKSIIAKTKLSASQEQAARSKMTEYLAQFLKNPSRFDEDEESVSKANKKAKELFNASEKDLDKFKVLLDDEIERLSKKDPVSSVLLAIVGYKSIENIEAGETPPDDFGDLDDEDMEYEDDLSPGEEEEIEKDLEKQSDADTWTQIAREEGFASAAGARQYAYKPMIKMFLQIEILSSATMEKIISLARRSFRRYAQELQQKNKITPVEMRKLMSVAKIGPDVTGNEIFRIFFSELFYQPYVNNVLKDWRDKTEEIFKEQGVSDDILEKHGVTLVRMIVGETRPKLDKIKKIISMDQFRNTRRLSRQWIEDRNSMNQRAQEFAKNRMINKSKVVSAFKKAQTKVNEE
tara:strand:+ start:540 stop:2255 length:1716 start_codon:yes stop_codon:yes gene_type:complete